MLTGRLATAPVWKRKRLTNRCDRALVLIVNCKPFVALQLRQGEAESSSSSRATGRARSISTLCRLLDITTKRRVTRPYQELLLELAPRSERIPPMTCHRDTTRRPERFRPCADLRNDHKTVRQRSTARCELTTVRRDSTGAAAADTDGAARHMQADWGCHGSGAALVAGATTNRPYSCGLSSSHSLSIC